MSGEKLLPCPFCGSEARLVEDSGIAFGWCPMCNVKTRASTDERVAVERWNTRAAVTDRDFAMAVHDGELWGKCSECRERRGYYLDAETIQRQQERIAELEAERDHWQGVALKRTAENAEALQMLANHAARCEREEREG